jgi:hypothetical protein
LATKAENTINRQMVKRLTALELNALLYTKVLPYDTFDDSTIKFPGTPIYDINGELLFYRIPISRGQTSLGYTDIAANFVFGSPIIAVGSGQGWNQKDILNKAITIARRRYKKVDFDNTRFVAYSFPKIAIQFLKNDKETLMLEFGTWIPVPKKAKNESDVNFQRWSLIEETPNKVKRSRSRSFEKRISNWEKILPTKKKFDINQISLNQFKKIIPPSLRFRTDSRELHYSTTNTDHFTCDEVRGQLTNVWCVAASVHMILDFYRYNYAQTRIADELDLGTLANPNGLPYSRDADVVTVMEGLTNNALDANMNTTPAWSEFVNEIRANRPLVSFIPGHSRTIAGYTYTRLGGWYLFRGLLVYDPWPPTTGVITRWENFDNQSYRRTFTAHVTLT